MTENERIIKKIYGYFDNITPIKADCGMICNNKCCKGNDTDGMLLFPGEEKFFKEKDGFNVFYDSRYGYNVVSCSGVCNRSQRPLSCRIFPYFIYASSSDNLSVAPDLRASDFCPLLTEEFSISKDFLRALRISAKLMESNIEYVDFLKKITAVLTDFNNL